MCSRRRRCPSRWRGPYVLVEPGALERPVQHPAAAAVNRSGSGSPGDPNPSRASMDPRVRAASRRPDGDTRTLGEGDTVTTLWPAVSVPLVVVPAVRANGLGIERRRVADVGLVVGADRAVDSQAEGRGFETRRPLSGPRSVSHFLAQMAVIRSLGGSSRGRARTRSHGLAGDSLTTHAD